MDLPLLWSLFQTYPGRSIALSVVPTLLAIAQGVNALVHGLWSPLIAGFVLALLAFAVGATRHSLAAFRTSSLEAELSERDSKRW